MTPRRFATPRMLAVVAAATVALAGCANDASGARPSASPSTSVRATWFDVAKCMRAHGYPNFPDPVQNAQGRWEIPQSPHVPARIDKPPCDALAKKAKQASRAEAQPSAQDMAKLRQYATCMRDHGMPNHPDPDSEGNFGLPIDEEKSPAWRTAQDACKQYAPPQRPK